MSVGVEVNTGPLDDFELFELLLLAYPEKFADSDDEAWEAAMQFADEISGFDELADLLGRVVMLTMPMRSALGGELMHCLGKVEVNDADIQMTAAVRRAAPVAKVRTPDIERAAP